MGGVNVSVLAVIPYCSFAKFYSWGKQQGGQDIPLYALVKLYMNLQFLKMRKKEPCKIRTSTCLIKCLQNVILCQLVQCNKSMIISLYICKFKSQKIK